MPIVADEARTFGMDNSVSPGGHLRRPGQLYKPQDAETILYYRESKDGQMLEEGITEAGSLAPRGCRHGQRELFAEMMPFFIYYSMFGFQRVGDSCGPRPTRERAGLSRGVATSGRTTLGRRRPAASGRMSYLAASAVPNCRAYDPAYAYEVAVIVLHGARRMMEGGVDEFYYVTVMNEIYAQPSMPAGVEDDIMNGMYRLRAAAKDPDIRLGSA